MGNLRGHRAPLLVGLAAGIAVCLAQPLRGDSEEPEKAPPSLLKPAEETTPLRVFVTGDARGYIEPCGCEKGQFGGLPRRGTIFGAARRPQDLAIDLGNFAAGQRPLDRLKLRTTDLVWQTPVYDGALDCAAVLGPSGTVAESYVNTYDGTVSIADGSGSPISTSAIGWRQGYAGMERDDETSLLYARNRYYSPADGRWITEDPADRWHDAASNGNGYCYVGNYFRNAVDPFGLAGTEIVAAGTAPAGVKSEAGKRFGGEVKEVLAWQQMVNAAIGLRDCKCNCIDTLVIVTHGYDDNSGLHFSDQAPVTWTSTGKNGKPKKHKYIGQNQLLTSQVSSDPSVAKLKGCLCPGATVVVIACYAGNGFGQALSSALGKTVIAPTTTKDGWDVMWDDMSYQNKDEWVYFLPRPARE